MRRLVILVLTVTVTVTLAGLAASWVAGDVMTRGAHTAVVPVAAPAEDFMLRSPDGVAIAATFRPGLSDRAPAVLLLHGVGASRQATAGNAAWLAGLGYAALTIDFRGHGQSDLARRTFGLHEALDARVAFDWLKRRQHGARVAVIGISLGGAAALIGDAGPLPADALILQAVYPDIRHAIGNRIASRLSAPVGFVLEPLLSFQSRWRFGVWPARLSPRAALARYRGPVLVIGGREDRSTPPAESRAMALAARGGGTLWLVPTGDHAAICDLVDAPYRTRVATFLESTLSGPGPAKSSPTGRADPA